MSDPEALKEYQQCKMLEFEQIISENNNNLELARSSLVQILEKLQQSIDDQFMASVDELHELINNHISGKPMYIMFERSLNCDPKTDHQNPKNVLPLFDEKFKVDFAIFSQQTKMFLVQSFLEANKQFLNMFEIFFSENTSANISIVLETLKSFQLNQKQQQLMDGLIQKAAQQQKKLVKEINQIKEQLVTGFVTKMYKADGSAKNQASLEFNEDPAIAAMQRQIDRERAAQAKLQKEVNLLNQQIKSRPKFDQVQQECDQLRQQVRSLSLQREQELQSMSQQHKQLIEKLESESREQAAVVEQQWQEKMNVLSKDQQQMQKQISYLNDYKLKVCILEEKRQYKVFENIDDFSIQQIQELDDLPELPILPSVSKSTQVNNQEEYTRTVANTSNILADQPISKKNTSIVLAGQPMTQSNPKKKSKYSNVSLQPNQTQIEIIDRETGQCDSRIISNQKQRQNDQKETSPVSNQLVQNVSHVSQKVKQFDDQNALQPGSLSDANLQHQYQQKNMMIEANEQQQIMQNQQTTCTSVSVHYDNQNVLLHNNSNSLVSDQSTSPQQPSVQQYVGCNTQINSRNHSTIAPGIILHSDEIQNENQHIKSQNKIQCQNQDHFSVASIQSSTNQNISIPKHQVDNSISLQNQSTDIYLTKTEAQQVQQLTRMTVNQLDQIHDQMFEIQREIISKQVSLKDFSTQYDLCDILVQDYSYVNGKLIKYDVDSANQHDVPIKDQNSKTNKVLLKQSNQDSLCDDTISSLQQIQTDQCKQKLLPQFQQQQENEQIIVQQSNINCLLPQQTPQTCHQQSISQLKQLMDNHEHQKSQRQSNKQQLFSLLDRALMNPSLYKVNYIVDQLVLNSPATLKMSPRQRNSMYDRNSDSLQSFQLNGIVKSDGVISPTLLGSSTFNVKSPFLRQSELKQQYVNKPVLGNQILLQVNNYEQQNEYQEIILPQQKSRKQ